MRLESPQRCRRIRQIFTRPTNESMFLAVIIDKHLIPSSPPLLRWPHDWTQTQKVIDISMQQNFIPALQQSPPYTADPLGETLLELYFERGFGAGYARAIRDELGTLSGVTERFIEQGVDQGDAEIKAAAPVLRRLLAQIHRGVARLEPPLPVEHDTTYVPLQQAAARKSSALPQ